MSDQERSFLLFKKLGIEMPCKVGIQVLYYDWIDSTVWSRESRFEKVELLDIAPDHVIYRTEHGQMIYRPMHAVEQIFFGDD